VTQVAVAVDVRGADKTYPNGTHALQPVDLRIEEGEFVTLLGPSGCGKSTLLKMIAGLLEGDSGEILLWGQPTGMGARLPKKLAFVFQAPTLMPWTAAPGARATSVCATRWRSSGWRSSPRPCPTLCRAACRCGCRSHAPSSPSRNCC
jgi:ABC-type cobalamin/Fe3+-siderophores transport system ATPase subunit